MKKQNILKSLLVSIILTAICICNINFVQATTTTKITDPNEMIKIIPDVIYANVKEINFDEFDISKEAKSILINSGVDLTGYTISGNSGRNLEEDIHKTSVSIGIQDKENPYLSKIVASKDVTIKYTNTDDYNKEDEAAVIKMVEPLNRVESLYEFNEDMNIEDGFTDLRNALEELIDDDSISFEILSLTNRLRY